MPPLAIKNAHPRDKDIVFDEPTHRYTIKGVCDKWISCTGFIHVFFPDFNPVEVIAAIKRGRNYANSPYFGRKDAEIMATWKKDGQEASQKGTAMHLEIETFFNREEVVEQEPPKKKSRPSQVPEWTYFQNFWADCSPDLIPYRTEWEVFSEEYKLAGSIDCVFYRPSKNDYVIYDWKRSKEIKTENNWDNAFAPLDHLPACNYWQYSLQLNIYKWFLETYYGLTIGDLYLIILHPGQKNYKRMKLNIMREEVEAMLECRANALKEGNGKTVLLP